MRIIEYYGTTVEIDNYEAAHRYTNQTKWAHGIPINPTLRPGFDDTPNELRDPDEVADWWGKPYILTEGVDQYRDTWAAKVARHKTYGWDLEQTQAEFEAEQAQTRAQFMQRFPEGIRYTVRCLDGGAHDRSTWCGEYASLAEAVQGANARAAQQNTIQSRSHGR